jgi:hypothetical protein
MHILGTREPSTPDGSLPSCWELALRGCLGRQYPCVKGSVSVSPAAAVGLVNEEGEMVLGIAEQMQRAQCKRGPCRLLVDNGLGACRSAS